jgi:hypothetical protein
MNRITLIIGFLSLFSLTSHAQLKSGDKLIGLSVTNGTFKQKSEPISINNPISTSIYNRNAFNNSITGFTSKMKNDNLLIGIKGSYEFNREDYQFESANYTYSSNTKEDIGFIGIITRKYRSVHEYVALFSENSVNLGFGISRMIRDNSGIYIDRSKSNIYNTLFNISSGVGMSIFINKFAIEAKANLLTIETRRTTMHNLNLITNEEHKLERPHYTNKIHIDPKNLIFHIGLI